MQHEHAILYVHCVLICCLKELYAQVVGILNKLTRQKFSTLMQQVLDLRIDTDDKLKGCMDIIFEKVQSTSNLSFTFERFSVWSDEFS